MYLCLSACALNPEYTSLDAFAEEPLLTENRRLFMIAELKAQRVLWAEKAPENYSYTISNNCFCPRGMETGPNDIRIEDHQIVGFAYQEDSQLGYVGNSSNQNSYKLDYKVSEVFDIVDRILSQNDSNPLLVDKKSETYFVVKYDDKTGFPVEVSHSVERVLDGHSSIRIENFIAN